MSTSNHIKESLSNARKQERIDKIKRIAQIPPRLYCDSANAIIDQNIKDRNEYEQFFRENFSRVPGALGNSAKSQAALAVEKQIYSDFSEIERKTDFETGVTSIFSVDRETGEIANFVERPNKRVSRSDADENRRERYRLQNTAARILRGSRVSKCHKLRQSGDDVTVYKSLDHGSTHYVGLQTCGSVWSCPVCAAKISERRTVEVQTAIENHLNIDFKNYTGDVCMITFTFAHTQYDDLKDMLERLSDAQAWLKSHRDYKKIVKKYGRLGTIRALEVTHGGAGWHPHIHEIWLVDYYDQDELRSEIFDLWKKACLANDLGEPNEKHGVRVDGAEYAASYVAKEMTKSHTKKGRSSNRSPFDLLRDAHDGDKQAAYLFKEFSNSFRGKRQLVWSRGLKDYFLIDEMTDAELSAQQEDYSIKLGKISQEDWRAVLKYERMRSNQESPRAIILELAKTSFSLVEDYLQMINPIDRPRSFGHVISIDRPVYSKCLDLPAGLSVPG